MSKYYDRQAGFPEGKQLRPEYATEKHLEYLDGLRESGVTNMFGARPWLMEAFPDLDDRQAAAVLGYWMRSFSERHQRETP